MFASKAIDSVLAPVLLLICLSIFSRSTIPLLPPWCSAAVPGSDSFALCPFLFFFFFSSPYNLQLDSHAHRHISQLRNSGRYLAKTTLRRRSVTFCLWCCFLLPLRYRPQRWQLQTGWHPDVPDSWNSSPVSPHRVPTALLSPLSFSSFSELLGQFLACDCRRTPPLTVCLIAHFDHSREAPRSRVQATFNSQQQLHRKHSHRPHHYLLNGLPFRFCSFFPPVFVSFVNYPKPNKLQPFKLALLFLFIIYFKFISLIVLCVFVCFSGLLLASAKALST